MKDFKTKIYSKRLTDRCNVDLWRLSSILNNFCWFEILTLQSVIKSRNMSRWHVKKTLWKSIKCVAKTWIEKFKLNQKFCFMKQNTVSWNEKFVFWHVIVTFFDMSSRCAVSSRKSIKAIQHQKLCIESEKNLQYFEINSTVQSDLFVHFLLQQKPKKIFNSSNVY